MRKLTPRTFHRSTLRSGFTLTELLIVMAILVLLVSLVAPRLLGSKKKADISAVKTQIGMLESALERYAVDMNTFPTRQQGGLKALITKPGGRAATSTSSTGLADDLGDELALNNSAGRATGTRGSSNWDGPYLKRTTLPNDPWGNGYGYAYPPKKGKSDMPDIWSFGPDGKENTPDDIVSWSATKGSTPLKDKAGDSDLVSAN
jgi:general secretion pathway protein G